MSRQIEAARRPLVRAEGEFLYRFEAALEVVPIGIVPEGLRMVVKYDGQVTRGRFEGARVWGVDHLLMRRDGVGVIDTEKTIEGQQWNLYEHVRGYCSLPEGLEAPPLEAILSPDFTWPDLPFPIQGFSTFRAPVAELRYLNTAFARIDGWANFVHGRNAVETRLLSHASAVEGPRVT